MLQHHPARPRPVFLMLAAFCCARAALGQSPAAPTGGADATARAESLFAEAKAAFTAGNLDEACPKFVESHRLDPDTGALLAAATCHRKQHRNASAWAEFTEAEARAHSERNREREQYAATALRELKSLLSTVTVTVAPNVAALDGLEVHLDGGELPASSWNAPRPLDGGAHVVEASAPGRQAWRRELELRPDSDRASVEVPMLEEKAPVEAGLTATVAAPAADEPDEPEAAVWGPLEWAGVASAGAGVVSLGVGSYFLASALSKDGKSDDATAQGDRATAFAITGGVLLAAGVTLVWVGRSQGGRETEPRLALSLGTPGPSGVGVSLWGAL